MPGRRIEDVWLSDLRFADLKPNQQPQTKRTEGVADNNPGTTTQELAGLSGTFPRQSEAKAYDRLAADKPGEELTPEATIWKLYVAEAEEFDSELVEREHRNIDVMLVFAALFSAILTAFLLDSKNLMRADPADATTLLLTRIAQRLENPSGSPQSLDIPTFEPTAAARWINGLWFASLGLSLAAALLSMMAKEWLTTFAASRPRPPHSYTIERQARLDALSSWGALQMIDHLPLFLHVALLLFSLGLVVYLYTSVDLTVASIVALMTGATILFYIITTGLASLYEVCPFDTQLSYYCRRMLRHISHRWKFAQRYKHYFNIKRPQSFDYTTKADLHALQWLANHARDPRVSDSAYQALAGLRLKPRPELSTTSSGPSPSLLAQSSIQRKSGRKDKLITNMFIDVCHRLHQARLGSPHELAASFGVNVARYASTLPHFVAYLHPHCDQGRLTKLAWSRMVKIGAKFVAEKGKAFDPARTALDALDSILQDECPPFTADAYAWITAAELRLTISTSLAIKDHEDMPLLDHKPTDGTASDSTPAEAVVIDAGSNPPTEVTLFDLRARYSRSLARASIQMVAHSDGSAPMSAFSLIQLLDSIRDAARCLYLNPTTSLSTHHPQDPRDPSILPVLCVSLSGTAGYYSLVSGEIGDPDGILGGILDVLGDSGAYPVAGVESAAGHALEAIAPLLIRQWLNLTSASTSTKPLDIDEEAKTEASLDLQPHGSDPPEPNPVSNPISLSLDSWPSKKSLDTDDITMWVLSQILYLAAFAKLHRDRPGVEQLLELSLRAFNRRSKNCYPGGLPVWAVEENAHLVRYLVTTEDAETAAPHGLDSISDYLLQLLAFKFEEYSSFSVSGVGPSHLFRIIQNASTSVPLVERLLVEVSSHGSQDLIHFTSADQGFQRLLELAERSEYMPAVALCVFDLITKVAAPSFDQPTNDSQQPLTLAEDNVEAFLKAVTIVLNHPPPNGKKSPNLSLFLSNLFSILGSLQGVETAQMVSRHLPRVELEKTLQSNLANSDAKRVVSTGLEKYAL